MNDLEKADLLDLRTYLESIVKEPLDKFNGFITWTEKDKNEFRVLLDELKHHLNDKIFYNIYESSYTYYLFYDIIINNFDLLS